MFLLLGMCEQSLFCQVMFKVDVTKKRRRKWNRPGKVKRKMCQRSVTDKICIWISLMTVVEHLVAKVRFNRFLYLMGFLKGFFLYLLRLFN